MSAPDEAIAEPEYRKAKLKANGQAEEGAQGFQLESYTHGEVDAREKAQRDEEEARAKVDREAQNKADADRDRDGFTLTGSNRSADVLAAAGQEDIFGEPGGKADDALFSRNATATQRAPVDQSVVDAAIAANPMARQAASDARIVSVFAPSELPAQVLNEAANQGIPPGEIMGVLWKGRAYIVRQNHTTQAQVEETLIHEVGGHGGARALLGDALPAVFLEAFHSAGGLAGIRQIARRHGVLAALNERIPAKLVSDGQRVAVVDEMLALAQGKQDNLRQMALEWLNTLRNYLMAALDKVGAHGLAAKLDKFDATDAAVMLHKMREAVVSGGDIGGYPTSTAKTLQGVFKDVFPAVIYHGEHTLPGERRDTGADHRYVFEAPETPARGDTPARSGFQFTVFTTDSGKVWLDILRSEPGAGGSQIYAALANYAYNTGKVFEGDPAGVSPDALIARMKMMLSSALRFGTTRHLGASSEQKKGGSEEGGVLPLKWEGSDMDRLRSLIHTFIGTAMNRAPKLKDYHYDFERNGFYDRDGNAVKVAELLNATHAGQPGTSGMGAASGRAAVLIKSLIREEGRGIGDGGILQAVLDRSSALVDGDLKSIFSKSPDNASGQNGASTAHNTPIAEIRDALRQSHGTTLERLEQRGLVTLAQSEDQAFQAAAEARAKVTGQPVAEVLASMHGSVNHSAMRLVNNGARTVNDALVPDSQATQPTITYKKKRDLDIKRSTNGAIEGFFDPVSGQAFMVADNLTAETAGATLLHEVGVHMANDGTLDTFFARSLELLNGNDQVAQEAKRRFDEAGETSGEEAMAYIATAYELNRARAGSKIVQFMKDLTAAIRAWALRNRILLSAQQLTPADVAAIARANMKRLAHDGREGQVVGQDVQRSTIGREDSAADAQFTGTERAYGGQVAYDKAQADGDIRFSLAKNSWQQAKVKANAVLSPESMDQIIYNYQDKYIDLKRMRDHLKAIGGVVTDMNDAYLGEEMYHQRLASRNELFIADEVEPLAKELNQRKVTVPEFEKFLHARHAPEANAAMMKRNPSQHEVDAGRLQAEAEVRKYERALQLAQARGTATKMIENSLAMAQADLKEWNSAQPFMGEEQDRRMLSGMSDQEAAQYMASLTTAQRRDMNALAAMVDSMQEKTLATLEGYGLMTKAALDTWRATYQHYVPLHRDEAHETGTAQRNR